MGNNKKAMFISGIIGVGIGLFISGIVLSFLTYNVTNINVPNITNHEQINTDDVMEKIKVTKSENTTLSSETEEMEIKEPEEPKELEEKVNIKPEIINIDPQTIEVEINETATASQIAELLANEGVISDADEFLSYIVSKKAARTLIHGRKIFEINSDYETALEVLMIYK